MGFTSIDFVIVVIYLIASVWIGAKIGGAQRSTSDYFLGGRRVPWYAVSFSIVATETSVLTFIGVPAISYLGNMTFLQISFGYILGRILVSVFFIPAYYKGNLQTAYHYLGERFGQGMRNATSITFMLMRVLADGVRLFATAVPLALILKSSAGLRSVGDQKLYIIAIVMIGVFTVSYTYVGGVRSIIWMDFAQMIVYIGGAFLAGIIILNRLPDGWETVRHWALPDAKFVFIDSGLGLSLEAFFQKPYTLFTAVVGGSIFGMASHGTDQLIIQRVLTCSEQRNAQRAMWLSGIAVCLQFALFLFLGVMLYAFYQGASVEELGLTRADGIFPKFIIEEMPVGISGIIVAALFAAAMSTLSSSVGSLSSAAVLDIYAPLFGKTKSDADLLRISRIITIIWGFILVITAIGFIGIQGTVVEIALGIASYTYGGLLGSFLLGLIVRNAGSREALIAFFVALIGMVLFIQNVKIAWPLYTLVGSALVLLTGFVLVFFKSHKRQTHKTTHNTRAKHGRY